MSVREWWMATDAELQEITHAMHFAHSIADYRGCVVAVGIDLICKPLQKCRPRDMIEVIRPLESVEASRYRDRKDKTSLKAT